MARSLDQILQELDAGYNPGRQLINEKLNALPGQAESEISGLNATKDAAFTDIVAGARDRGMGFSGIPLAEQAKYSATQFLPAVARVRSSQNDVRSNLLDALNNSNLDQRKTAMSIRDSEMNRDEARAAEERAASRARAAAAASSGGLSSLFGGGGGVGPAPAPAGGPKPGAQPAIQDQAYLSTQKFLSSKNDAVIRSDYEATLKSANFGNPMDKLKVQLYLQARPDLFVKNNAIQKGVNSGALTASGYSPNNTGLQFWNNAPVKKTSTVQPFNMNSLFGGGGMIKR